MDKQNMIKHLSKKYNKKEQLIKCMLENVMKEDKKSINEAEKVIINFFK